MIASRTTGWISMRGRAGVLPVLGTGLSLVVLLASVPVRAGAAEPVNPALQPIIDATAAREASPTSAVVEAEINPQGNAGAYQINLVARSHCSVDQAAAAERVESESETSTVGSLEAATSDVAVSHTFMNLRSDYVYWYTVYAATRAGGETGTEVPRSFGLGAGCADDFPEGSTPENMPYLPRVSLMELFTADEIAERIWQEAEEERQLTAEHKHEEQQAREAVELAEEEAALKRREQEEEDAEDASHGPACIVPDLKGRTLKTARRALGKAHCRLGKVRGPLHHLGMHVVVGQSRRHGEKLAGGAKIAVRIGTSRCGDRRANYATHGPSHRKPSGRPVVHASCSGRREPGSRSLIAWSDVCMHADETPAGPFGAIGRGGRSSACLGHYAVMDVDTSSSTRDEDQVDRATF